MAKRVAIPTKAVSDADKFVAQKPADANAEPVIRLSVDLPESLHTELKLLCVRRRLKMAKYVRDLISQDLQREAA